MGEILKYLKEVKKVRVDELLGTYTDFPPMSIKCIDKANYSLTVGKVYNLIYVSEDIAGELYIRVINDINECSKYNEKYFKIKEKTLLPEDTQGCDICKLSKPLDHIKIIDGEKVCLMCSINKIKVCSQCKVMFIDSKEKTRTLENEIYCVTCFNKVNANLIQCKVCKNNVLPKNCVDKGFGLICINCKDSNYRKFYDITRLSEQRTHIMSAVGNSFNKLPQRTFGVEFEMNSKGDYLRNSIKKLMIELRNEKVTKKTTLDDYIYIKNDGSLDNNIGIEIITTPLLGDLGAETLKRLMNIFSKYFEQDKKCGLHIHLGISDYTNKELIDVYYVYQKLQSVFKYYVAPERIKNSYCKVLPKYKIDDFKKALETKKTKIEDVEIEYNSTYTEIDKERDRYSAVNFTAVEQHGTLEIRLMEGHLDYNRLMNWIELHMRVLDWIKERDSGEIYKTLKIRNILGNKLYEDYITKRDKYKENNLMDSALELEDE